jgi:hypothetical protein
MRTKASQVERYLALVGLLAGIMLASVVSAGDRPVADGTSPSTSPAKPAAMVLCDEGWDFGFSTVAIDSVDYDGKAQVKDYDPQHPDVP